MKLFSSALAILSIITAATAANCPPHKATLKEKRAAYEDFVQKFYIEKNVEAAFVNHMDENYIQHNPNALSGRQSAIDFLVPLFKTVNITLLNKGFYEDRGWVHFRQDEPGKQPEAIVDVLRFNGSCIVEHWDVIQERPLNATNPLAMW